MPVAAPQSAAQPLQHLIPADDYPEPHMSGGMTCADIGDTCTDDSDGWPSVADAFSSAMRWLGVAAVVVAAVASCAVLSGGAAGMFR